MQSQNMHFLQHGDRSQFITMVLHFASQFRQLELPLCKHDCITYLKKMLKSRCVFYQAAKRGTRFNTRDRTNLRSSSAFFPCWYLVPRGELLIGAGYQFCVLLLLILYLISSSTSMKPLVEQQRTCCTLSSDKEIPMFRYNPLFSLTQVQTCT